MFFFYVKTQSDPVNQKYDSDFRLGETTEKKLFLKFNWEAAFYHKILKYVFLYLIGWFCLRENFKSAKKEFDLLHLGLEA